MIDNPLTNFKSRKLDNSDGLSKEINVTVSEKRFGPILISKVSSIISLRRTEHATLYPGLYRYLFW